MDPAPQAASSPPSPAVDELAKAWLLGLIERTPFDQVGDVDLDLLATQAVPMIAGILGGLESGSSRDLPFDARERLRWLCRLRHGDRAAAEIPRDLAVLHSVLVSSLNRGAPARLCADFGRSVQRLAEIFGSLHGTLTEGLVHERAPGAHRSERAALPGTADLHHMLQVLIAEYRRYGHPFALALVDVEGLGRINEAYGRQSGDWMSSALAAVIRNQIRIVDHAFRLRDEEFCVLAPNVDAGGLRPMADRLARVVRAAQSPEGPRIAISAGVSACPEHGHDGGELLEVAAEALEAARASGQPVEVAASNGHRPLHDG